MIGEKFVQKIARRIATEKNIERFVKYYWIVSTFRLSLGASIALLILFFGYRFEDTVKWIDILLGGE
uniref:Uncharacterized protein n=1 Tax=Archaeoglobus fulgidus TaxID=2234 RepID=A0A7C3ZN15_ARCFL